MVEPPKTKSQRFEMYLWQESYQLAYNHLIAAPWVPERLLQAYRIVCCLALWSLSLYHLIHNTEPTLFFFTNWGIFLTTITYTLFTAFYLRQFFAKASHEEHNRNFYSPWLLWKWCVFFYETSLTFEILITMFFWSVLFPIIVKSGKTPGIFTYIDHIAPLVILTLDYAMNRIPFNMRHLPLSVFILFTYGIVNLTKTLVTGKPVYPPLNFKDFMSIVWSTVLLMLEILAYVFLYHLTRCKNARIAAIDDKQGSELTVFNISNMDRSALTVNNSGQMSDIEVEKIGNYSKI